MSTELLASGGISLDLAVAVEKGRSLLVVAFSLFIFAIVPCLSTSKRTGACCLFNLVIEWQ